MAKGKKKKRPAKPSAKGKPIAPAKQQASASSTGPSADSAPDRVVTPETVDRDAPETQPDGTEPTPQHPIGAWIDRLLALLPQDDPTWHGTWRGLLLAAGIPALLLLPFLNKAYHVDDPLFVWTAQHILTDPINFFDFDTNWYTETQPMYEVMQNPPLVSYYMAPIGARFGWSEWVLHLAMLPWTALAGAGAYAVAGRFSKLPGLATAFALCTPAFFVSAQSVMSDVPMVAAYFWAIVAWIYGLDRNQRAFCVLSAVLIGVGALTKYFAASLIPLLAAYTLLRGRKHWGHLWTLLIAFGTLVAYEWATLRLFDLGHGLIADAGTFTRLFREREGYTTAGRLTTSLPFLGGCALPMTFALPLVLRRWATGAAVAAIAGLVALAVAAPDLFAPLEMRRLPRFDDLEFPHPYLGALIPPNPYHLLQWAVWTVGAMLLGANLVWGAFRRPSPGNVLLLLWFGGTFTFVTFLNHFANARVVLPMLLPIAIGFVARFDHAGWQAADSRYRRLLLAPLGIAAGITALLAVADYTLAGSARRFAREYGQTEDGRQVIFTGHSGFQYYMEALGAEPIDLYRTQTQDGTRFIAPWNNWSHISGQVFLNPQMIDEAEVLDVPVFPVGVTAHYMAYGGFYSDSMGNLPFSLQWTPGEKYVVATCRLDPLDDEVVKQFYRNVIANPSD